MILRILFVLIIAILITSCQSQDKSPDHNENYETQTTESNDYTPRDEFKFVCDYMGQKAPGDVPVKFAPDVITTKKDDSCFEISYSGKEMVFNRDGKIYISNQHQDGKWNLPTPMFDGGESSFSKDGQIIYFNTRASFPGSKVALNVWYSIKQNGKWSEPKHFAGQILNQAMHAPSVAANGNMYSSGITLLKYKKENYQTAEKLDPPIKGSHPFINADESYIIFDKKPPAGGYGADLYISFQKTDSTWTEPVWLGDKINTDKIETNAYVTPDGKYMFFTRSFDIYWVDAAFIGDINMKVLK